MLLFFSVFLGMGIFPETYLAGQPALERQMIFSAATSGHVRLIRRILDQFPGAVHLTDKFGRTPLHLAVQNGHHEAVEVLLNRKSNPAARDKRGWMPLHYAAKYDHPPCAKILIERGAPINAPTTEEGYTPLHVAAQENRYSTAEVLVKLKAAINPRDAWKNTPLRYVDGDDLKLFPDAYNEKSALRELLKKHGAIF